MRKLASGLVLLAAANSASAISITFDYTYDTNGFFADPARRALLEQAAATFTPFTDQLASVQSQNTSYTGDPSFVLTWAATFTDPATGAAQQVSNLVVPQDTLIVYAGGRNLSGSTLGIGGPGGYQGGSYYPGWDDDWVTALTTRNQPGVTNNTDFARWGGAITFDADATWHFGSDTAGLGGKNDFLSVAVHELGHVLGLGLAGSWNAQISGGLFTGTTAASLYDASVPLDPGLGHWLNGTSSQLPGVGTLQETAMDPSILVGTRKLFTTLDYAGMKDIGWEVPQSLISVPEPSSLAVLFLGAGVVLRRRRAERL